MKTTSKLLLVTSLTLFLFQGQIGCQAQTRFISVEGFSALNPSVKEIKAKYKALNKEYKDKERAFRSKSKQAKKAHKSKERELRKLAKDSKLKAKELKEVEAALNKSRVLDKLESEIKAVYEFNQLKESKKDVEQLLAKNKVLLDSANTIFDSTSLHGQDLKRLKDGLPDSTAIVRIDFQDSINVPKMNFYGMDSSLTNITIDSLEMELLSRSEQEMTSRAESFLGEQFGGELTQPTSSLSSMKPGGGAFSEQDIGELPSRFKNYNERFKNPDLDAIKEELIAKLKTMNLDSLQHGEFSNAEILDSLDKASAKKKALGIGWDVRLIYGEPIAIDMTPFLTYQLLKKLTFGLGVEYRQKINLNIKEQRGEVVDDMKGANVFMEYTVFKGIALRSELNHIRYGKRAMASSETIESRETAFLFGVSKTVSLGSKLKGGLSMMYNFSKSAHDSPLGTWVVRYGFRF